MVSGGEGRTTARQNVPVTTDYRKCRLVAAGILETKKTIVMKKIILFLIVAICFSTNSKAIAQGYAAITTSELKTLYNNREYKKAQSYTRYIIDKKDAAALIILGDCYWADSNAKQEESDKIFYQSSMSQMAAISQGLYWDNSLTVMFCQQLQQEALTERLQAVELYSQAAQLGDNNGNQRMASINTVLGNNANTSFIPNYNNTPNPQYQTKTNHSISTGRSAYQINNEIQRVQRDLNNCINNQARANDSKSYAAAAGYNSIIASYENRLNQLNLELSQASR